MVSSQLLGSQNDSSLYCRHRSTTRFPHAQLSSKKIPSVADLCQKKSMVFSKLTSRYEIDYFESVGNIGLWIVDCEVKPLWVAVGIGVVLHEKHIAVGLRGIFERAQKIATFELRIKSKRLIRFAPFFESLAEVRLAYLYSDLVL